MKKADVRIGGVYHAKVTNKKVEVRIDEAKTNGGWSATNLATGKKVTIKTAQRLTEIPVGRAKVKKSGNLTIVENEPATVETFDNTSAKPKGVLKKPKKGTTSEPKDKKMSCVDAALAVLADSGEPMNAKEMIEAMEATLGARFAASFRYCRRMRHSIESFPEILHTPHAAPRVRVRAFRADVGVKA